MNYKVESPNKLILGTGNYMVTATINALIFKKIDKNVEIGTVVNNDYAEQYSIIDIVTVPFHNYSEVQ